ncbi:MAG: PEGA domain-containing protein [Deltaproteobacteria bacterium]|nr:PEGA domain-containing protein [Deltaproteobacteria bacterium]
MDNFLSYSCIISIVVLTFFYPIPCAGAEDQPRQSPLEQTPLSPASSPAAPQPAQATSDRRFDLALPSIEKGEVSLFENKPEAALAEFERAYDMLKGHAKQCKILYNIGLCHSRLSRYSRALYYYERYLNECDLTSEERDQARRVIDEMQKRLATLRISVNVESEVWIDNTLVGEAPGDLMVSHGRHTVELRAEGYESSRREVSVASQTRKEMSFRLEKISQYRGISPYYCGTTAVLTVVSAVVGTIFGVQALSAHSDAEKDEGRRNLSDTDDKIRTLQLETDIFFAAAGVFALASGILYFLTDWEGEAEEADNQGVVRIGVRANRLKPELDLRIMGSF